MLSDSNIRQINRQIAAELRIVDSSIRSHAEKMVALERVTKLQTLLSPQPSREEILSELAASIVEAQRNPQPPTPAENLIADLATLFRR